MYAESKAFKNFIFEVEFGLILSHSNKLKPLPAFPPFFFTLLISHIDNNRLQVGYPNMHVCSETVGAKPSFRFYHPQIMHDGGHTETQNG
jgi:hypothetical protein